MVIYERKPWISASTRKFTYKRTGDWTYERETFFYIFLICLKNDLPWWRFLNVVNYSCRWGGMLDLEWCKFVVVRNPVVSYWRDACFCLFWRWGFDFCAVCNNLIDMLVFAAFFWYWSCSIETIITLISSQCHVWVYNWSKCHLI